MPEVHERRRRYVHCDAEGPRMDHPKSGHAIPTVRPIQMLADLRPNSNIA